MMDVGNRLSMVSVNGSVGNMGGSAHVFHGFELLVLRKLNTDAALFEKWKEKLRTKAANDDYDLGEIPQCLWFFAVTLDREKERFLNFFQEQVLNYTDVHAFRARETLLDRYLNYHSFTELRLDGMFKYGDDNTLPPEIFKCSTVKWLSMKYNYLDVIPCDIGRMASLEYLALTNNKLQNKSIPYTLTFCSKLKILMLDNNLLDALPGFLLKMPSLETVHRHGNHNYFKSTFMWYHTDVNERILTVQSSGDYMSREPEKLQFWAVKTIIGSKINFFASPSVAPVLKDYISSIYRLFSVCGHCNSAKLCNQPGYKVITFKNPYLGNTCVPFQHWACSLSCATALEIPAREEQISAARELDRQYDAYIKECQRQYRFGSGSGSHRLSFRRPSRRVSTSSTVCNPSSNSRESMCFNHERESRLRLLCCGRHPTCNCCVS